MNILDKIVNAKKLRLDELKKTVSLDEIKQKATSLENKPSSFRDSLLSSNQSIIAEIKQASPSAGIIDNNFDPERQAIHYENIGATAISVLTEEDFFLGSAEHLQKVKQKSSLPILRKDFNIHEYQIYEARILDADCILLIASILNDEQISHFIDVAKSLNLDCLMEVHYQDELNRIESIKDVIIGVNNRNLKTFEVDISLSVTLKNSYQGDNPFVAESGIKSQQDLDYLMNNGINNFLIGESLMKKNLQI